MSNTDPVEWSLFDTDLITKLAILPTAQGHLYFEFNEPGSGEIRIPLDATIATSMTSGRFVVCSYRGSNRGAFFIDNLKQTDADQSEGGGRWLSVSGRGALAILDDAIVWDDGSGASTRSFVGKTKAYILKTLIDEAVARGGLARLTYDFTATTSSDSASWTDTEDYDIEVGKTLLDVVRMFAKTGEIEFGITLQGGATPILLSAYKNGIGSDKSATVFMRIGSNCEEVSTDERGDEIKNVYLTKYKDGYITNSDATSITNRRRRETFLSLEQAQSSDSASTFAAAQLDGTKDPKVSRSVRVYDGVTPYLFVNYVLGDTITIDKFGTQVSKRILGIQADFEGDIPSNVVLELETIFYDKDLKVANALDDLKKRWATAHDANLTEVKDWFGIGSPNGEIFALHVYGNYLYVGGSFTAITGILTTTNIARYNIVTGTWEAMDTGIADTVYGITDIDGTAYVITDTKIYYWTGSAWGLLGTAVATNLLCIATDGSNIYVGAASITSIDGVGNPPGGWDVFYWDGTWHGSHSKTIGTPTSQCNSLTLYNGKIYGGFESTTEANRLQVLNSGTWATVISAATGGSGTSVTAVAAVGDSLIYVCGDGKVRKWDGVASTQTLIGTSGSYGKENVYEHDAIGAHLSDAYIGAQFLTMDSVSGFNNVGKYSGGIWSKLSTGMSTATPVGANDRINSVAIYNDSIYVGGLFTTAGGKSIVNLAVWITGFQDLVDHLAVTSTFNMGAAIHAATASAVTDNDEFPFWEDTAQALRKITWANIKATLKTYFDTLYAALTHATQHKSGGSDAIKLDELAAPTDVTTLDASTSAHGLVVKATAPAANVLNVVGIANGETAYTNKSVFDGTAPAAIGTAAAGTSLIAAHRDHVHAGAYTSLSSKPTTEFNANDIFRCDSPGGTSAWAGTFTAAGSSGSTIKYATTSGTAGAMTPASTSQLGKMRLYNTTRGNSVLISNHVAGTITSTANYPGDWQNGDVLTIASQTVTGGTFSWVDIEITSGPTGKSYIFSSLVITSATPGDGVRVHPFETLGTSKIQGQVANVAGQSVNGFGLFKLTTNVFSLSWTGTPTVVLMREIGYLE